MYVKQPPVFEDPNHPNYMFKLHMTLYGLKQTSTIWYERLSSFLVSQRFKRGNVDTTLFTKCEKNNLTIVYVDDILFGLKNDKLGEQFAILMEKEFQMIMMRELNFFFSSKSNKIRKRFFSIEVSRQKNL